MGFAGTPPIRPVVSAEYLLGAMAEASVPRAYVVLRRGKWDIPAYFSENSTPAPELAFIVTEPTDGVPFSIDCAYPWIRHRTVVFGFPDIIFRPSGVFTTLLDRLETKGADVTLCLFPATDPRKADMVNLDDRGQVREIVIKPGRTDLRLTWISCVWEPAFTDFLHQFLADSNDARVKEVHVGEVIQAAIHAGMEIDGLVFPDGEYLDIGTPEDLARAQATTRSWAPP